MHRTPAAAKRLLHPSRSSTHDLLVARAIPNERLIRAFRLTNTFVSDDLELHRSFLGRARSLLQTAKARGWAHFQSITTSAVDHALPDRQVQFDVFIQDITLRTVLVGLLQVDSDVNDFAPEDVVVVTRLINDLWARSKSPSPIPPQSLELLNKHLRQLIPNEEQYPNPLDFVIPVWETFWRVVAIAVYHALQDPQARLIFSQLNDNPTEAQFQAIFTSPSAQNFISEIMRLYPPSKRISRAEYVRGPVLSEAADMETILRSPEIWGPDAHIFNPARFRGRGEDGMDAFGYGNLRCPAAKWAPVAAGVVTAAIVQRLDGARYKLCVENAAGVGGRDGWSGKYVKRV
ncbi:hypothetical protein BD779DRAFT_1613394 [Infundibulicybe gibba]|nr:hypothetical protein BD779DRAFT_1613394 [Infundibulicybe gibba]